MNVSSQTHVKEVGQLNTYKSFKCLVNVNSSLLHSMNEALFCSQMMGWTDLYSVCLPRVWDQLGKQEV